jgi:hypothetical protein
MGYSPLYSVRPVLSPWTSSVTWNDNVSSGPVVSTFTIPSTPQFIRTDIKPLAQNWVSGATPNNGILIHDSFGCCTMTSFASSEHSDPGKRPYLEITYTPDTTPPQIEQGGELVDSAHEELTGEAYEHWIDAVDGDESAPGSGVRRVEVFVDGQSQASRGGLLVQDCALPDCDGELDWDFDRANYAVGSHIVRVMATDLAGNSSLTEFAVTLSATRTPDPPDSESPGSIGSSGGGALAAAGPPGRGCGAGLGPVRGTVRPVRSNHRTRTNGTRETTTHYSDATYFVALCAPEGRLIEAQRVAPVRTPAGVRMLMVELTQQVPGRNEEFVTTYYSYPRFDDPRFEADWKRHGEQLLGAVRPPTPASKSTP